MNVSERAQARPRSQVASSTPSSLRKISLAGGSSTSHATARSTAGSPTDSPPKSSTAARRPPRTSRFSAVKSPWYQRGPALRPGQPHGFVPQPFGGVKVVPEVIQCPATPDVLPGHRVHGRERLTPVPPQGRVAGCPARYLGQPQGTHHPGKVHRQVRPSRADRRLRGDHLRVLTVDPADHRPVFRVAAAGSEHGDHLRNTSRQQRPENRQPPGLFHDRRRSPRLARQPDQEILPQTEQRVRRAARTQPPNGQTGVMRHRPVNQGANQPGVDRDFVVVENFGHSRSQSHPLRHGNRLSNLDPAHPLAARVSRAPPLASRSLRSYAHRGMFASMS